MIARWSAAMLLIPCQCSCQFPRFAWKGTGDRGSPLTRDKPERPARLGARKSMINGCAVNVAATQRPDLRIRLLLVALTTFQAQTRLVPRMRGGAPRRILPWKRSAPHRAPEALAELRGAAPYVDSKPHPKDHREMKAQPGGRRLKNLEISRTGGWPRRQELRYRPEILTG